MIARLIWPDEADGWLLDPVAGPLWVRRDWISVSTLSDPIDEKVEDFTPIGPAPQIPGALPWQLLTRNGPASGVIWEIWSPPPGWPVGVSPETRDWILQRMAETKGGTS